MVYMHRTRHFPCMQGIYIVLDIPNRTVTSTRGIQPGLLRDQNYRYPDIVI